MSAKRPPIQLELDLPMPGGGEAPRRDAREVEAMMATGGPESPAFTERFMEAICDPDNIEDAVKAVVRNKGAPGVDGMTVKQLPDALKARWPQIEVQLLAGRYRPQPVRRVKIPKPNGGERHLGIPTVIDRVIQQAILQRLQPLWDPTFSEHAYGFRPGRSAQQAVAQAQAYVLEGYQVVVDIDLAKFFDRVNHDRLMATVASRVADRRLLRLIRSLLTAGVLDNGLFEASEEGTPQGGPLSPLLSNLVLDELDRELKRRGHRFVRYADDCNIYVRSEKAGRRVMQSVTRFIERRLKLQVNAAKSAVDRPWRRSFLGFTLRNEPELKPVHRRQGRRPVQTPGARADGAASGRQPGADDPRAGSIPSGMGRLLRLQPVAGAAVARRLGPTTPALRRLGPVEDAWQALPRTAPP
jgi:RNA-directed DNA polymerase